MSLKVVQLQALFPQFDREILESILQAKKDNVDDAVDTLLAMDSHHHHNPDDPDLHVGVAPGPSRRTLARQRLRHRKRANLRARREAEAKKVKWVRFNPFVMAIAKEPLKDNETENPFDPLVEEEEEGEWQEMSELVKDLDINLGDRDEDSFEDEFPALPSTKEEPTCEKEKEVEDLGITSTTQSFIFIEKVEEPKQEQLKEIEKEKQQEPEKEKEKEDEKLMSVKLYFSESDIHRISIKRNDPEAFSKLSASIVSRGSSSTFSPKYEDEEKERVTIRSQEEFEECIRVHEAFIWPQAGQRSVVPILRLYL